VLFDSLALYFTHTYTDTYTDTDTDTDTDTHALSLARSLFLCISLSISHTHTHTHARSLARSLETVRARALLPKSEAVRGRGETQVVFERMQEGRCTQVLFDALSAGTALVEPEFAQHGVVQQHCPRPLPAHANKTVGRLRVGSLNGFACITPTGA